ncbi:alanine racemase [Thalassomonas viridans]|uniref:Alanine racemase n=1 Tax=Thalassomonas viridans TaxID=137584 RepID=A0AAF0CAW1_9GAMM|nr:alanine racemase [Thalassomonas viridans]WDE09042.1 alanine racemase [Thalassomonas viridans]
MKQASLNAVCHPQIQSLLRSNKAKLQEWINGLGSPLHLVFPEMFQQNIVSFKQVLERHQVDYQLLFAKKANKARCFAAVCAQENIGIDVASVAEFELALAAGVSGADIGVSGPHKSEPLLRLAMAHNALIAIDSVNELSDLACLAAGAGQAQPVRILLRIRPQSQKKSRFGLAGSELEQALAFCLEWRRHIQLLGFSCHLSGYCTRQRGQAGHQLIDYIEQARQLGLGCDRINIGGGFAVSYLDSPDWRQSLDYEAFHADKAFGGFYPYHNPVAGADALHQVLLEENEQQLSLGRRLRELSLTVLLEPGRALLDQAGISLFSVQGCKPVSGTSDCHIATVSGMSFSLSEQWFNTEYLPSPLLISEQKDEEDALYKVAVAGNSCLDDDMLSWRFIAFEQYPKKQDVIAYINTAGYQMDSNESAFHSTEPPRKVAVMLTGDVITWQLDNQ